MEDEWVTCIECKGARCEACGFSGRMSWRRAKAIAEDAGAERMYADVENMWWLMGDIAGDASPYDEADSIPFGPYEPPAPRAPGEHTPECLEQQKRHDEWVAMWPNFCRACGGGGAIVTYGHRYYPDGSGEPDWVDPCSCVEEGQCPRCGFKGLDEDGGECSICGWTYNCNDCEPADCICGPDY